MQIGTTETAGNATRNAAALTSDAVQRLYRECHVRPEEAEQARVWPTVRAVVSTAVFHPDRLAAKRDEIAALLAELPDQFHALRGGGWTFLNACDDRHGNQWTGEHRVMEMLFALGLGADLVLETLPREMWSILPGGMPYYAVKPLAPDQATTPQAAS